MADKPHVLIVGAGAIGSFYGAILKRAGCRVSVVLRSEYDAVHANGFSISSPLGDLSYRPDHVYRDGDTPEQTADYVICCVKVLPTVDRAALLEPWVGEGTRIVLIENGINIEPAVADAFPNNPLISCLAFIAVSRMEPGVIEHKAFGQLTFGAWPQGISDDCRALETLLVEGGIKVQLAEQVVAERWRKSLWNTPFNPLSVLAGGADTVTMLDTPGGEALVRAMMAEVKAVAAADGHPLPDDAIDKNIAGTRKMSAYKNSMALDYLAGRPMEIEAILGNVVAMAQRLEVSVPRLETMQVTLAMRERLKADAPA
ncbi:ketopantoate reductase family protein [Salinisphaera aquimarina]|uniref:2-dehydropantoate 2-reductase n=1 Tax=Salinisphaera aquimarina TaxID=2094031 RepID=A0ABV7EXK6_9GAMM